MTKKNRNDKFDDIDFVGTQEKISPEEREKIYKKTGEIIRAYKKAMAKSKVKKTK